MLEEGFDPENVLKDYACRSWLNTRDIHWDNCPGGTATTTCICYGVDGRPGAPRYCGGKIVEFAPQKVVLAALALGGMTAVVALLEQTRKVES